MDLWRKIKYSMNNTNHIYYFFELYININKLKKEIWSKNVSTKGEVQLFQKWLTDVGPTNEITPRCTLWNGVRGDLRFPFTEINRTNCTNTWNCRCSWPKCGHLQLTPPVKGINGNSLTSSAFKTIKTKNTLCEGPNQGFRI